VLGGPKKVIAEFGSMTPAALSNIVAKIRWQQGLLTQRVERNAPKNPTRRCGAMDKPAPAYPWLALPLVPLKIEKPSNRAVILMPLSLLLLLEA
jgi:hypothetical protein